MMTLTRKPAPSLFVDDVATGPLFADVGVFVVDRAAPPDSAPVVEAGVVFGDVWPVRAVLSTFPALEQSPEAPSIAIKSAVSAVDAKATHELTNPSKTVGCHVEPA